jgi:hypothetical protein
MNLPTTGVTMPDTDIGGRCPSMCNNAKVLDLCPASKWGQAAARVIELGKSSIYKILQAPNPSGYKHLSREELFKTKKPI